MADGVKNSDKPAVNEGFPMKQWTVEVYILDQDGKEKPARCFTKAVYHLHPSFANPTQSTLFPTLQFPMTRSRQSVCGADGVGVQSRHYFCVLLRSQYAPSIAADLVQP